MKYRKDAGMRSASMGMLMCLLLIVFAGSALKGAVDPNPGIDYRADLNAGAWVRGPNLPAGRQDAAAVVLADRVYVIGGFGPRSQQMNTTLVWDPQVVPNPSQDATEQHAGSHLGSWTYAAPIPEPVDHAAAVALGSHIYVAGGRIEDLVSNKFWRYDVANDTWVELPSMPVPRYGAVMQTYADKLYVIGGAVSHGNDERSIEIYDIAHAQWTLQENALTGGRTAMGSAMLDDRIALLGGRDDEERNLSTCDLYDPVRNRWSACSPLRVPRSDFGLSVVAGRLVAVGGDDLRLSRPTQTTEISEPYVRGWLSGPWLPGPRHGMSQVTVGNVVWVIGGASWSGTAPSNLVLRYVSPVVRVKLKGRVP
ncbi:MAG: hypothetical protein M3007_05820 [Candidatus Eremiobacteraeota bacterium]|nr:hypothetical protein [Candidatus Eremiobacteraeota bacterium]